MLKTIATQQDGIQAVITAIEKHQLVTLKEPGKQLLLLAEKAWQLIQQRRMKDVDKKQLQHHIRLLLDKNNFNLYRFVATYNNITR